MKDLAQLLRAAVTNGRRRQQPGAGASDAGHLARVGQCLSCGHAIAAHWDLTNRFRGCLHVRIVPRRRGLAPHQVSGVIPREASGERGWA